MNLWKFYCYPGYFIICVILILWVASDGQFISMCMLNFWLLHNQRVLRQKSHSKLFLHCISIELLPWSIHSISKFTFANWLFVYKCYPYALILYKLVLCRLAFFLWTPCLDWIWEKPAFMHATARYTFHHQMLALYTLTNNWGTYWCWKLPRQFCYGLFLRLVSRP